ncbi:helix-turn-helix transcriptional regulator [Bacillus thuringiensis]|uniref:helix-turn-helix domain-containing protein n=1 Tax=Bacillus thuringiensis TaxID=1428 RepID=UPI003334D9DE
MSHIGDTIKKLRIEKKLSQQNLAEKLNMNRVNISNYERGIITNIPSDVLIRLSEVFEVSIDSLLGKGDKPEKKTDTNNSSLKSKEFSTIQRYANKLNKNDQQKLIKIMEATFDEIQKGASPEDDGNDDF